MKKREATNSSHGLRIDFLMVGAARPGSRRAQECTSRPITEPIPFQEDGITLGPGFNLEDPDLHYVYVCIKVKNL